MRIKNIFKLIIAIAVCEVVGIGGAFFTSPAVSSSWYSALEKPFLQPPSWIFSPVWIMLYALMGIAAWLVWSFDGAQDKKKKALTIFGLQLFLNAIWSIIFFGSTSLTINGLNNIGIAFIDIVLLWFAIVWTIIVFYKISPPSSSWRTTEGHGKLAAYLLAPYLLWVSFASYLNYSIWILNL